MTLDKQKILNELGSVVDQLQGADCGCMGKIFSNCTHQNNSGNPPSYGGGGCGSCGHHCRGHQHQGWGQNAPCGGEPHSNQSYMNASSAQMNAHNPQMNACNPQMTACNPQMNACNPQMNACNPQMNASNPQQNACNPQMNVCNPQKLYADTYKYLNQNLMQPVLREVYNDLKSITPANTIANNPIASQLGLTGHASPDQNANMNNAMAHSQMAGGEMNNALGHNQMTSGGNMAYNQMTAGGMNHNMPQNQMTAGGISNRMPQHQMYENGGNMYGNTQENTTVGNMSQNMNPTQQMGNMGATPMRQQMTSHHNQPKQGQQGIGMFNSMFPGVMQGLGGDLDFDPMAIAVQMNPSNQQRAAMDSMNKMMMGNKEGIGKILNKTGDSAAMQPAIKDANAAASILSQNQPAQMQQNTTAYQAAPMQQNAPTAYQQMQQNVPTGYQQVQQNTPTAYQQIAPSAQQNVPTGYQQMTPTHDVGPAYQMGQQPPSASMGEAPPQQVYTAYNGAPMMNQQEMQRDMHHSQYQQMDPRAAAVPAYEGTGDPNAQNVHNPQYLKEPIFPAEPSRQPYYSAQQVKQLPARIYQEQQPLPTQRMPTRMHDPMTYSNVKSTVSKTSLMGMKRIGNVPSRSQLQHIYNQYKGSHSFTQQNVRPTERTTHSAGSLNVGQMLPAPVQVPIERVAGDTINNQINRQLVNKVDHVIGRMGDVPANNKPMDNIPKEEPPTRQSRCRNGLQDVVFTSYPSSAAWSFHGNHGNRLRA